MSKSRRVLVTFAAAASVVALGVGIANAFPGTSFTETGNGISTGTPAFTAASQGAHGTTFATADIQFVDTTHSPNTKL
ncbi:MAG: hypothetical protein ACR2N4_08035, partial [Jatrophihabitans sp.]